MCGWPRHCHGSTSTRTLRASSRSVRVEVEHLEVEHLEVSESVMEPTYPASTS